MPFTRNAHSSDLLETRPLIRTMARDQMAATLRSDYGARGVSFIDGDLPFMAVANRVQLSGVTLHYCRYDSPTEIDFVNMAGFRQFLGLSGTGAINVSRRTFQVSSTTSGVTSPHSDFKATYGGAYSQLVLQFDEQTLLDKLEKITGADAGRPIELQILETPNLRALSRLKAIALSLSFQFSAGASLNLLLASELEQALISSFLIENVTNYSTLLSAPPRPVGRRDTNALEDYIQENWRKPLTIEDVAMACGVSVRSVFNSFKHKHGMTPMAYLRSLRLERANQELSDGRDETSVLDVALKCGFSSFGRFAQRYKEKFGELPSATLTRSRSHPNGRGAGRRIQSRKVDRPPRD